MKELLKEVDKIFEQAAKPCKSKWKYDSIEACVGDDIRITVHYRVMAKQANGKPEEAVVGRVVLSGFRDFAVILPRPFEEKMEELCLADAAAKWAADRDAHEETRHD